MGTLVASKRTLRSFGVALLAGLMSMTAVAAQPAVISAISAQPVVVMDTSMGTIEIELNKDKAPVTVENFLAYTNSGYYDGTIFHRIIKGFMAQGGGFDADMKQKSTRAPIRNESSNGLDNARGTIAMARTNVPDSATSQFFINLTDNDFLNGSSSKPGYAVFGKVINGMDVIDKMAVVRTGRKGGHGDVPVEAITIESVKLKSEEKKVPVPAVNKKAS